MFIFIFLCLFVLQFSPLLLHADSQENIALQCKSFKGAFIIILPVKLAIVSIFASGQGVWQEFPMRLQPKRFDEQFIINNVSVLLFILGSEYEQEFD
ncbi:hypothetical protein T4B_14640 [Trichinella pseudospiralis]|uniref:Transmembrane protein n=1 Tax=Trichinella pseudospiralis TaxID=6337 RepID=A0A0V1IIW9_TRIPS|nr:hypothetical protein T4B_14640 [Trichinella pseudospiralis]